MPGNAGGIESDAHLAGRDGNGCDEIGDERLHRAASAIAQPAGQRPRPVDQPGNVDPGHAGVVAVEQRQASRTITARLPHDVIGLRVLLREGDSGPFLE